MKKLFAIALILFSTLANAAGVPHIFATQPAGNVPASYLDDNFAVGGTYTPSGTGAVTTTVQSKLQSSVSVLDFGADPTGTTDTTPAIQLAVNSAYAAGKDVNLYFPTGKYLLNGNVTYGNTSGTVGVPVYIHGDGLGSIIKTTTANTNPFLWQGPYPDVDGAGNRTESVIVEKLQFIGPGINGSNTNSIALNFYGVQWVTLRDLYLTGWWAGEKYINTDLIDRYNVTEQANYNGVWSELSSVSGTYNTNGQMNSFNTYGGRINNNTNIGINYIGGLSPAFYGVNFTANGTSLVLSPTSSYGGPVTVGAVINDCYFEGDTGTTFIAGGGSGIVRGILWDGGQITNSYAGPSITISNYSDAGYAPGRGYINTSISNTGGGSNITQTTSAEKIDVGSLANYSGSWNPSYNFNGVSTGVTVQGNYQVIGNRLFYEVAVYGATTSSVAGSSFVSYPPGLAPIRSNAGMEVTTGGGVSVGVGLNLPASGGAALFTPAWTSVSTGIFIAGSYALK